MPGTYQYDVEIKSNVAKLLSDMKQVQDRLDTVEGKEYKIKLNVDEKKLSSVISNLEKMLDSLGKGTGDFKQFENLSKELSSIVSEVQSLSKAFGKVDDSGAKTLLYSIQNIDKSLYELSQNILNVNKNMSNMGGNTSGAVKQVENITNESKKAASALDDVAKAQAKVNGQKTNISLGDSSTLQQQEKFQNDITNSIQEQNKAIDESIKKTLTLNDVRQKQWEIIQKTNPKWEGTNSTWIDTPEDVKTFHEVNHKDSDYPFNEDYSDDWTVKDKINVEATGKITVYSSYPIEDGNWVTPSKEEGLSYAGSGKLYSATMDPRDIAWVDAGQGQVAHISDELKEVIDLATKAETQVQNIDNKTNESNNIQSTVNKLDEEISKYETIVALVKEYYELSHNKQNTSLRTEADDRISAIRKELKSYEQNPNYNGDYKMGLKGSGKNIFGNSVDLSQEEMLAEICNMLGVKIPQNAEKAKQAIKEVSSTASQNPKKDAFPKTSENLEQVAKSEQKVQQEAVATDKALDNISFTPNTEGFDDIIAKFGILREQAEQITKIVKTTKQTADGAPNISYKATLKNGSSYYLGENSTPQVLNASETVYDAKADNAKKLEREKQIWNELTSYLDRYATIQKRIASNNALSTDNDEVTKLLEHIHELQRNDILPAEKLTASNEKLQQINQTVADLKAKLKESTLDSLQGSIDKYQKIYDQRSTYSSDFTPSEQYTKNLTELNTAIGNLVKYRNTLKNVSEVTVEQEAELKRLVTACEKASDSFKSLSASEKGASQIAIDKLVQRINKDLDECTNYSKEAKLGLRVLRDELESSNPRNLKEITSEIINIENAEIRAGRAGRSFFDTLKNSGFHQIAAQMAGMFGFYDVINLGKEGFNVVRELNTALTEMRKVSDESIQTLKDYQKESFNTADAIATTGLQMQNSIADWQRLGYSIEEANELAKNSNIYKNVGDMDISTATEHMVSSVQAWKSEFNDDAVKTSEEVMNRYNKIGNEFAISSADIGEAMETSAAALKAGGNDLNEALGIITAGNIIQQDASTTSSAMKILSLRIRGAKADLESMGESTDDLADSTSKLREEIKGLTGVDIMADEDTFKSTAEIIKEIGAVWNQLSDVSQAATLEKLAGKNRASTVAGLIENYETIDKVIEAASNADNSALDENQKIIESIDGRIQQLSNRVQEFWYNLVDDSVVKNAVSALTTIVEGGTKLIDTFGTLPTLLAAIGAGLSFKNIGKCYVSA